MLPRKGPASCCFGDGCAGTWPLAPGTWHLALGTWHLFQVSVVAGGAEGFSVSLSCVVTCRSWHPATGTRLLAPGTWHPAPGTRHPVGGVCSWLISYYIVGWLGRGL